MKRLFERHPWALAGCVGILLAQAFAWSWKTSGVLQATELWDQYPWGFSAVVGDWPLLKENVFYVEHHQAFLGVPGQFVRAHGNFELMRTLYGYLTQGLWFLGPIASGLVVNVTFWGLACISAAYVASVLFPGSIVAPWVGLLLTLSGQGFVNSVGEVSPHVLGYAIGFWLAAYVCAKHLWSEKTGLGDHLLVHGFLGVMKLGYESAWLYYPFLIAISGYAWSQRGKRVLSIEGMWFLARCSAFSLGPGAFMVLMSKPFGGVDSASLVLRDAMKRPLLDLLVSYFVVLADSILSFGPTVLLLAAVGVGVALSRRERATLIACALLLGVFAATAVLLLGAGARGYTTFALAMPVFMLGVVGYDWLWRRASVTRYAAPTILALGFVWINAPLVGFNLPIPGFSWGYLGALSSGHWEAYRLVQFK
jgi:hypothetical protein